MRVGQNPAKSIDHVPQPERVTIAILTYIPFLSGYYEQSLEVLKTCLGSLWENTALPYDLFVFDNASCQEVRNFLQEAQQQGRIQYLVFQGAPGEVIAYADSDIYFYPGWLEQSLEILDTFPKVGMVSSRPLRTPETYYTSTLAWAQDNPGVTLETGSFMSWEIYQEHTDSLGVSVEQAREWYQTTYDRRVQYAGKTAFIGAAHFQFVANKQVLNTLTPLKMDRPMGQVRSLDEKLNEAGYLRLTTAERLVKHLGNRLSGSEPGLRSEKKATRRLLDFPPIRRSLLRLYDQIFRMYYTKKK